MKKVLCQRKQSKRLEINKEMNKCIPLSPIGGEINENWQQKSH